MKATAAPALHTHRPEPDSPLRFEHGLIGPERLLHPCRRRPFRNGYDRAACVPA